MSSTETSTEKKKEEATTTKTAIEAEADKLAKVFEANRAIQMTPEQFNTWQNNQQKQIEALAKEQNANFLKILETLKPAGSGTPSSPAAVGGAANESLKKVAEFLGTNGLSGESKWTLNKQEYIDSWAKHFSEKVKRVETITTTNVPGIIFDQDVLLVPGGRSQLNIRPFVNYKEVAQGADTFNWYTFDKGTVAAVTPGTDISESSQTFTRVQGTVAERAVFQRVSFFQEKTLPFDVAGKLNASIMMDLINDEAVQVLTEGATASAASGHWLKGSDGSTISADDTASITLQFAAMNKALEVLETEGYYRSDATAFLHPQQHAQLLTDSISTLGTKITQFASAKVQTGIIEEYLGCRIVVTPAVYMMDNTTNDAYRAVISVPQAIGLASKGDVEVEAQRRVEKSQIYVTGRHYVDAASIDNTGWVRISTTKT